MIMSKRILHSKEKIVSLIRNKGPLTFTELCKELDTSNVYGLPAFKSLRKNNIVKKFKRKHTSIFYIEGQENLVEEKYKEIRKGTTYKASQMYRVKQREKNLDTMYIKILDLFSDNVELTKHDIVKQVNISEYYVFKILKSLYYIGLLKRRPVRKSQHGKSLYGKPLYYYSINTNNPYKVICNGWYDEFKKKIKG
jgi:predicted transcriptional regulator